MVLLSIVDHSFRQPRIVSRVTRFDDSDMSIAIYRAFGQGSAAASRSTARMPGA